MSLTKILQSLKGDKTQDRMKREGDIRTQSFQASAVRSPSYIHSNTICYDELNHGGNK